MIRRQCLIVLVLVLSVATTMAEAYIFEDIIVDGRKRVDPGMIAKTIKVQQSVDVTTEEIDKDIQDLFALGKFSDIVATIEDREGKQYLHYELTERPLVRNVEIDGNSDVTKHELEPFVVAKAGRLYDPSTIAETANLIKAFYVEDGYHGVSVDVKEDSAEEGEVNLTFVIVEGEQVRISDITFEGNTVFSDRQIKKFMRSKERWFLSWLTNRGKFDEKAVEIDREIIEDQYFNEGYVQAKVKQPVVELKTIRRKPYYGPDPGTGLLREPPVSAPEFVEDTRLSIHIEIEEGAQFTVGNVDFSGDIINSKDELYNLMTLAEGDVFRRSELRQSLLALNDFFADQGYAYANVIPRTNINKEDTKLLLTIDVEKGELVHIGAVNIKGNVKTRDKEVRRQFRISEGELYSASGLKKSKRNIFNLGYFEEVDIKTNTTEDTSKMDIDVEVTEKPTGTFSLGFGLSSLDGWFGQGSVTQDNFLGRGLKLNLSGTFGASSTTYKAGILDPYFLDTRFTLGFDVYKSTRDWTDYTMDTVGADIKTGYSISDDVSTFFIYTYEEKEIYDVDYNSATVIQDSAGKSTLSSLYASITRNTTDVSFDPTSGSVARVSFEYAGLGGTEKFAKYIGDYRQFFPLWKDLVLSLHGQVGLIEEVDGVDVPINERFFLGGLTTIRGLPRREVGPKEDGDPIGGHKDAFGNIELVFPVIKEAKLKGVLFFDGGNAWADNEAYFSSELRYGYGWGFRWFSPMGPLRLEWGYNLNPEEGEDSKQFEFSIGQSY